MLLRHLALVALAVAFAAAPQTAEAFSEYAIAYGVEARTPLYNEARKSRANNNKMDGVLFLQISLNNDGRSINSERNAITEFVAEAYKYPRFMGVDNYNGASYDARRASRAFAPSVSKLLIPRIVARARDFNYTAVVVDFALLSVGDRLRFVDFATSLKAALTQASISLMIVVPPATTTDLKNRVTAGYDYAALGAVADRLIVIPAADGKVAGPVFSYLAARDCIAFLKTLLPADKLILGLPSFGFVWNVATPRAVGLDLDWKDAAELELNPTTSDKVFSSNGNLASPSLRFKTVIGGKTKSYIAWYENAASTHNKTELAKSEGLHGVIVEYLGGDAPEMWDAVLD